MSRPWLMVGLTLLACGGCRARLTPDPAIRQELLRRVVGDQALRDTAFAFFKNGGPGPDSIMIARLQAQDSVNGLWLKAILGRYEWPGISSVGRDGAQAAFLLLQHARNDRAFQAAMLPVIEAAYRLGDVDGQDVSLLTDEMLRTAGRPQRYGTKAQFLNGRLVFDPIEDSLRIDERRASLGLPSFAEYVRGMESLYGLSSTPRHADLDHLILWTRDLSRGIEEFARLTGVTPIFGGVHPGRGTRNALVSLGAGQYLELLAPVSPPADSSPGPLVLMGWAIRTDSLPDLLDRGRAAGFDLRGPLEGSRRTADSTLLQWRTAEIEGPGLEFAPFFIEWSKRTVHPSRSAPPGCRVASFEVILPATTRLQALMTAIGYEGRVINGPAPALRLVLECPRGRVEFRSAPS